MHRSHTQSRSLLLKVLTTDLQQAEPKPPRKRSVISAPVKPPPEYPCSSSCHHQRSPNPTNRSRSTTGGPDRSGCRNADHQDLQIIIDELSWLLLFVSVRQGSDNQRVDPLGSWMDFVKRPVGNFPAKCRKRKRPLVKRTLLNERNVVPLIAVTWPFPVL